MKTMKTKLAILLLLSSFSLQAAAGTKSYPLKTCLVSGNTLGSMGDPVTKIYDGQEIKFCCKPCVKKFEANKAKYLAKLPR
ncbi:MAG: hypothetical protein JWR15_2091 [Prosthecobacter sp.]|nr:hypothetical protein [Prosthecobacter sp.]